MAIRNEVLAKFVGDVAHPVRRASAIGVYRFWRDLGFAAGGLLGGVTADAIGIRGAIVVTAVITFVSGAAVSSFLRETVRSG